MHACLRRNSCFHHSPHLAPLDKTRQSVRLKKSLITHIKKRKEREREKKTLTISGRRVPQINASLSLTARHNYILLYLPAFFFLLFLPLLILASERVALADAAYLRRAEEIRRGDGEAGRDTDTSPRRHMRGKLGGRRIRETHL